MRRGPRPRSRGEASTGGARCLVGKGRRAWATIDRLLAQGKLAGSPDAGNLWPTGAGYVAALHTFLIPARLLRVGSHAPIRRLLNLVSLIRARFGGLEPAQAGSS